MKESRNKLRLKRKRRVRAKIFGTAKKPRLAVFRSLKKTYAQAIDDEKGITLAAIETKKISAKSKKSKMEAAKEAGRLIAKKCAEIKITQAVFDRGGYKYHGRVKALAEGAREGGLKM
ncbi:50S ribosomal protein L18 [bacterium]|nr:50S ribosomal protein L18 [bacterium]